MRFFFTEKMGGKAKKNKCLDVYTKILRGKREPKQYGKKQQKSHYIITSFIAVLLGTFYFYFICFSPFYPRASHLFLLHFIFGVFFEF